MSWIQLEMPSGSKSRQINHNGPSKYADYPPQTTTDQPRQSNTSNEAVAPKAVASQASNSVNGTTVTMSSSNTVKPRNHNACKLPKKRKFDPSELENLQSDQSNNQKFVILSSNAQQNESVQVSSMAGQIPHGTTSKFDSQVAQNLCKPLVENVQAEASALNYSSKPIDMRSRASYSTSQMSAVQSHPLSLVSRQPIASNGPLQPNQVNNHGVLNAISAAQTSHAFIVPHSTVSSHHLQNNSKGVTYVQSSKSVPFTYAQQQNELLSNRQTLSSIPAQQHQGSSNIVVKDSMQQQQLLWASQPNQVHAFMHRPTTVVAPINNTQQYVPTCQYTIQRAVTQPPINTYQMSPHGQILNVRQLNNTSGQFQSSPHHSHISNSIHTNTINTSSPIPSSMHSSLISNLPSSSSPHLPQRLKDIPHSSLPINPSKNIINNSVNNIHPTSSLLNVQRTIPLNSQYLSVTENTRSTSSTRRSYPLGSNEAYRADLVGSRESLAGTPELWNSTTNRPPVALDLSDWKGYRVLAKRDDCYYPAVIVATRNIDELIIHHDDTPDKDVLYQNIFTTCKYDLVSDSVPSLKQLVEGTRVLAKLDREQQIFIEAEIIESKVNVSGSINYRIRTSNSASALEYDCLIQRPHLRLLLPPWWEDLEAAGLHIPSPLTPITPRPHSSTSQQLRNR